MLSLQRKGRGCQESFLSLLVPCLCLRACVSSSHFRGKANSQQSHGGRASLLISPFPSPTPCLEFVFITSAKCSFNLFPILSLLFKPFASLSMWKVSGMKEPRTWRKTLWVLHFLHFQMKKDGGKAGTPQSHWSLGVGARTKLRALCLSPVLCYVPVGEALVSKSPVSGTSLSLQKHRRGWEKKKSRAPKEP